MHTINITLEGGLIQDIWNIPDGIQIRVRDYDVEGNDDDRIIADENGQRCFEAFWDSEPTD